MTKQKLEMDLIQKLRDFFAERQDIMFAWLFGSYATGFTTRFSDMDIAVYVEDHTVLTDMDWYLQLKADLMELVNKEIDLVVLNNAKPLIKHTANMQKKKLLSRNTLFEAEYSLRVVKEYNDVRYWARCSRQHLLRGNKNG